MTETGHEELDIPSPAVRIPSVRRSPAAMSSLAPRSPDAASIISLVARTPLAEQVTLLARSPVAAAVSLLARSPSVAAAASLVARSPVALEALAAVSPFVNSSTAARSAALAELIEALDASHPALAVNDVEMRESYAEYGPDEYGEDEYVMEEDAEKYADEDAEKYGEEDAEKYGEEDAKVYFEEDVQAVSKDNASLIEELTKNFTSEAWKEYEILLEDGKVGSGKCKHCSRRISAKQGNGTSALLRHLERCQKREMAIKVVQNMNSSLCPIDGDKKRKWHFDPDVAREELMRMVALHGVPFSFVQYDGFRRFVASLNPWFKMVSRTTLKNDCTKAFIKQKLELQDIFDSAKCRFSLTTDMWTSNQQLGYMCVTCHYIDDDWKPHKRLIKFFVVEFPHTGVEIYNQILSCIQDWRIEKKIFGITLDNASNNEKMLDNLRRNLVGKSALPVEGLLLHNRCAAHVINLIAQEGLEFIDNLVVNIRETIKYLKTPSRKQKFEEIIAQEGIKIRKRPSLDTPTRWNSAYLMLDTAKEFKNVFASMAAQDANYKYAPSSIEWEDAEVVCKLLKVFYDATNVISGSLYPTSNLYFHHMWKIKNTLEQEAVKDTVVGEVANGMLKKFDKYWIKSYVSLCIPVILDPQFKLEYIQFRLRQAFGNEKGLKCFRRVEKIFRSLFNEYFAQLGKCGSKQQIGGVHEVATQDDDFADWDQHINHRRQVQVSNELDKYLQERQCPRSDKFDILNWWKINSSKYPILASMARDVLATPASSVASESAFSFAGRIISDHRSSLSPRTVETIMCLQDWFRGSSADRDKLITQTVEAFICFDNEARNEEAAPQEPSKVKHSNPNKARHSKVLSQKRARGGGPQAHVGTGEDDASPEGPSKVKHSTHSAENSSRKRAKGGGSQTFICY